MRERVRSVRWVVYGVVYRTQYVGEAQHWLEHQLVTTVSSLAESLDEIPLNKRFEGVLNRSAGEFGCLLELGDTQFYLR